MKHCGRCGHWKIGGLAAKHCPACQQPYDSSSTSSVELPQGEALRDEAPGTLGHAATGNIRTRLPRAE